MTVEGLLVQHSCCEEVDQKRRDPKNKLFHVSLYGKGFSLCNRRNLVYLSNDSAPEYMVKNVMLLYSDCEASTSVDHEMPVFLLRYSSRVGLSLLLFFIVMDSLTNSVWGVSWIEELHEDDPVLCREFANAVMVSPFLTNCLILYPLKKHQKTKGFLVFLGGIKLEYWPDIG